MAGFSLPIINILLVLIAVLTYFFGWIVLLITLGLLLAITVCFAIYDATLGQYNNRWYDKVYNELYAPKNIERSRVTIKSQKDLADHMLLRTWVDGKPDLYIRMDYNEQYEVIDSPDSPESNTREPDS